MSKKVVAMILAGGKGSRLEALTKKNAKPAVTFGAKYRIIDFPLSNCANSHITTVGVLTQYESVYLDQYIGNGEKWGLNGVRSLTTTLAPRQTDEGLSWYKGTADAIYANIDFMDSTKPDYILILSGDHIYSTSFDEMIHQHIQNDSDCTIGVYEVPIKEASRFGILVADEHDRIVEFHEKPAHPTSNLASMGIYLFKYSVLREALIKDAKKEESSHDFGKDVIPMLLSSGARLFAYKYRGYWKDVGTIASLHEANMDLLDGTKETNLMEIFNGLKIYTEDQPCHPQYIGSKAVVKDSLIDQGTVIHGEVKNSVVSRQVVIDKGAKVDHCVVMGNVKIHEGAVVSYAVVAPDVEIPKGAQIIGSEDKIMLYAGEGK